MIVSANPYTCTQSGSSCSVGVLSALTGVLGVSNESSTAETAGIRSELDRPLFPPTIRPWCRARKGFASRPMTTRAIQKLAEAYVRLLGLDPNVTVHSLRVTTLISDGASFRRLRFRLFSLALTAISRPPQ